MIPFGIIFTKYNAINQASGRYNLIETYYLNSVVLLWFQNPYELCSRPSIAALSFLSASIIKIYMLFAWCSAITLNAFSECINLVCAIIIIRVWQNFSFIPLWLCCGWDFAVKLFEDSGRAKNSCFFSVN